MIFFEKSWLWIIRIRLKSSYRILCMYILSILVKVEDKFWNDPGKYKDTVCSKELTSSSEQCSRLILTQNIKSWWILLSFCLILECIKGIFLHDIFSPDLGFYKSIKNKFLFSGSDELMVRGSSPAAAVLKARDHWGIYCSYHQPVFKVKSICALYTKPHSHRNEQDREVLL